MGGLLDLPWCIGISFFSASMALTFDVKNSTGGGGGDRTRFEFTIPTVKPTVLASAVKTDASTRFNGRPAVEFRPLRTVSFPL